MSNLVKLLSLLVLCLNLAFVTSCNDDEEVTPDPEPTNTIVDIATGDANFSSLVAALQRADLVTTLQGGEYTVFAPTNAAFETFLNGTPLDQVPVETLTQILLNHVVAGTVRSTDLTNGYVGTSAKESTTDNAISLLVNTDSGVKLNGDVTVTSADIDADNGVVHVVDKVIAVPTVVDLAVQGDFSILVAALTRADLTTDFVGTLNGDGPFTVFAPTDQAFVDLLNSNNDWNTLDDIPVATLEAVLKYHVVAGANVLSSTLQDNQMVTTFEGSDFTINTTNGATITDGQGGVSTIVATDVQGGNGVVHVIDKVILP